MRAAIVLLNFNGKNHLQAYLPGVLSHTPPDTQVIIADNASEDDSIAWLQANHPDLILVRLERNWGFAEGYNRALAGIEADYFVLLNTDVLIDSDWLSGLLDYMDEHQTVAACQPKIRSLTDRQRFEHAGAAGGFIDTFGYAFCRGRIFGTVERDLGQYDGISPVFWASGAAMVVRSDKFREAGGFDADFFAHMEEIDLCYRLHLMGYRVMAHSGSVIYHLGGGTLPYQSAHKVFLNFRNSLYLLLKNKKAITLCWLLPLRMVLDGIAGLLFMYEGKFTHLKAILRAHGDFYGNFGRMRRKRAQVQQLRSARPNFEGIYPGSIVWKYYVTGNRLFSMLYGGRKKSI